jgi:hypothetical protein
MIEALNHAPAVLFVALPVEGRDSGYDPHFRFLGIR